VRDDLVAEQIEVDPLVAAPPLRAAEDLPVELPSCPEIVDRKGYVEWRELVHDVRLPE